MDLLVAPRRYVLDTLLAEAAVRVGASLRAGVAVRVGASLRAGVAVTGVPREAGGRAIGVTGHDRSGAPITLHARYVVGAGCPG